MHNTAVMSEDDAVNETANNRYTQYRGYEWRHRGKWNHQ
jgi:hypothetical protein